LTKEKISQIRERAEYLIIDPDEDINTEVVKVKR